MSLLVVRTKELLTVSATYALDLVAGIAMSLVLPAFVSVDTYATVKVYLLYVTFVSVCNFGFNDGVYVKYGAYDYTNLPKEAMHSFIRHVLVQGLVFGTTLGSLGYAGLLGTDALVGVFLGVNLFVLNANGLYVFINQFTRRFSVNLANNLFSKAVQVILVVTTVLLNIDNPYMFILVITLTNALCLAMNAFRSRELLRARPLGFKESLPLIKKCYKSGFAIMVGYYAAQLILSASQFAVNLTCTTEEYAFFSFAFSVMNFLNVFINSVSAWLYPTMKRRRAREFFDDWAGSVSILCAMGLVVMLPFGFLLVAFVEVAIPKYVSSIVYFLIIFPSVAFNGILRMVFGNLFKACELERSYMFGNVFSALVSVALVALCSVLFPGHAVPFAAVTMLAVALQYVLLSVRLRGFMSNRTRGMTLAIVLAGSAGFMVVSGLQVGYLAMFGIYATYAAVVVFIFYVLTQKEVKKLWI